MDHGIARNLLTVLEHAGKHPRDGLWATAARMQLQMTWWQR